MSDTGYLNAKITSLLDDVELLIEFFDAKEKTLLESRDKLPYRAYEARARFEDRARDVRQARLKLEEIVRKNSN